MTSKKISHQGTPVERIGHPSPMRALLAKLDIAIWGQRSTAQPTGQPDRRVDCRRNVKEDPDR